MKRTLIVGYVLALALFLFGKRHPDASAPAEFRAVVDLTHSIGTPARWSSPPDLFETRIDAPAHFVHTLWTVDQIPAERLIAPLVVLDVSTNVENHADYQISVEDIAKWRVA